MSELFEHAAVEMDNEQRLAATAEQASTCTACALSETRRHVVFGEGNPRTPLVLVGEGPGEHEDASGRPFVGRAGACLDKALQSFGITRRDVYICNILKCRAAEEIDGRLQNRTPTADEVQACARWLDAQLTLIAPRVICCLGGPAAKHIIDKGFKITQMRGQFFPCRWAPLATACLHPAYVLRRMNEGFANAETELREDLQRAWERANQPIEDAPPPQDQLRLF
jgi:uracil-DNA glycosylase family 4